MSDWFFVYIHINVHVSVTCIMPIQLINININEFWVKTIYAKHIPEALFSQIIITPPLKYLHSIIVQALY